LDGVSLTDLANYVLTGATIYSYSTNIKGEELKTVNKELMNIGKKILQVCGTIEMAAGLEKASNQIQKNQKPIIDQTSKRNF
jgi:hypothetical protein